MNDKTERERPDVATTRLVFEGSTEKVEPTKKLKLSNKAPVLTDKPSQIFSQTVQPVDDDDLTVEELQRQQEEIDRKIQTKKEAEKKAVIDQIVNVVNTYKIPLDELSEALGGMKTKRKGVKATQKYQDPETGATWSGRGKEPTWIRDKDRTPFLIP